MQAYMKTNQPFYGIQAGPRRVLFRAAVHRHPITTRSDFEEVIHELWEGIHREEQYVALDVAERFKKFRDADSWPLFTHLVHTATHWDTLDWVAGKLVSLLILKYRHFEEDAADWAFSERMWVRRASILVHLRHKSETHTDLLATTILRLAHERAFFIRKAIGWVLRTYARTDPDWVLAFVNTHTALLSGLSRREALKHL